MPKAISAVLKHGCLAGTAVDLDVVAARGTPYHRLTSGKHAPIGKGFRGWETRDRCRLTFDPVLAEDRRYHAGLTGFTFERQTALSADRGRHLHVGFVCDACDERGSWTPSEAAVIIEVRAHRRSCSAPVAKQPERSSPPPWRPSPESSR